MKRLFLKLISTAFVFVIFAQFSEKEFNALRDLNNFCVSNVDSHHSPSKRCISPSIPGFRFSDIVTLYKN